MPAPSQSEPGRPSPGASGTRAATDWTSFPGAGRAGATVAPLARTEPLPGPRAGASRPAGGPCRRTAGGPSARPLRQPDSRSGFPPYPSRRRRISHPGAGASTRYAHCQQSGSLPGLPTGPVGGPTPPARWGRSASSHRRWGRPAVVGTRPAAAAGGGSGTLCISVG